MFCPRREYGVQRSVSSSKYVPPTTNRNFGEKEKEHYSHGTSLIHEIEQHIVEKYKIAKWGIKRQRSRRRMGLNRDKH